MMNEGVLLGVIPLDDDHILLQFPDVALDKRKPAQLHPIADLQRLVVVCGPHASNVYMYSMTSKLTRRDAFLYLAPRFAPKTRFAQCSTCRDWTLDRRCVIHGPKVTVAGTMSCGLYVWGVPKPKGTVTSARVTPEESGLVDRQVRCENCSWAEEDARTCGFYRILNQKMPTVFDLDEKIEPHGCCNAQQPQ